jgi:hypothetical protein
MRTTALLSGAWSRSWPRCGKPLKAKLPNEPALEEARSGSAFCPSGNRRRRRGSENMVEGRCLPIICFCCNGQIIAFPVPACIIWDSALRGWSTFLLLNPELAVSNPNYL